MKTAKTSMKCLYDCILNYLGVIQFRLKARVDFMPQRYMPKVRGIPRAMQLMTPKQCREQLTSTMERMVLAMTCADAIFLFFSILNPALLQSSKQIHLMPQKCWYCQAIIYMNMANGYTMQMLLPEAAHPRYTGKDPMIAPTNVFISEVCFILVQMKRQLVQMLAPIPAAKQLQLASPISPAAPNPTPKPKAMFGFNPFTSGLWLVLSIFLSSQTQMYWLSACVDMESATEEASSGQHETATGYKEYAPIVTIPFSIDNLNFVNYRACFNTLFCARVEIIVLLLFVNIINIVYRYLQLNTHSCFILLLNLELDLQRSCDDAQNQFSLQNKKNFINFSISSIFIILLIQMKNSSFGCLRSINNQLHNKLSQQNQYESYLKRIQNIVDRKPYRDTSPQFYMNFLQKCKNRSKHHKDNQQQSKIVYQNKNLLNKIMQSRMKKDDDSSHSYHINLYQKRNKEIERINNENLRIAKRITDQYSLLRKSVIVRQLGKSSKQRSNEKKTNYANWNYSPLKDRKLPKLVGSDRKTEESRLSAANQNQG